MRGAGGALHSSWGAVLVGIHVVGVGGSWTRRRLPECHKAGIALLSSTCSLVPQEAGWACSFRRRQEPAGKVVEVRDASGELGSELARWHVCHLLSAKANHKASLDSRRGSIDFSSPSGDCKVTHKRCRYRRERGLYKGTTTVFFAM